MWQQIIGEIYKCKAGEGLEQLQETKIKSRVMKDIVSVAKTHGMNSLLDHKQFKWIVISKGWVQMYVLEGLVVLRRHSHGNISQIIFDF